MPIIEEENQSSVTSTLTHRHLTLACDRAFADACFRTAIFQGQSTTEERACKTAAAAAAATRMAAQLRES